VGLPASDEGSGVSDGHLPWRGWVNEIVVPFAIIAFVLGVLLAIVFGVIKLGEYAYDLRTKPCRDKGGVPTVIGCMKKDVFLP
jgi:hypothetical protein